MSKFVHVTAKDNYILHIVIDDGSAFDFNVSKEIKKIPSYKRLYDVDFFKNVHFKNERIYWDYDHDFHIDQVLAHAKKTA